MSKMSKTSKGETFCGSLAEGYIRVASGRYGAWDDETIITLGVSQKLLKELEDHDGLTVEQHCDYLASALYRVILGDISRGGLRRTKKKPTEN